MGNSFFVFLVTVWYYVRRGNAQARRSLPSRRRIHIPLGDWTVSTEFLLLRYFLKKGLDKFSLNFIITNFYCGSLVNRGSFLLRFAKIFEQNYSMD